MLYVDEIFSNSCYFFFGLCPRPLFHASTTQSSPPPSDRTCCFTSCRRVTSRSYHYFVYKCFIYPPLPSSCHPLLPRLPPLIIVISPFPYNPRIVSSLLVFRLWQSPPRPIPYHIVLFLTLPPIPLYPRSWICRRPCPNLRALFIFLGNEHTPSHNRRTRVEHPSPSEQLLNCWAVYLFCFIQIRTP